MKKWLVTLVACTLILTPLLPTSSASAAPNFFSVKEVVHNSDRLVKIYALDANGEEIATGSGFVVTADGQIVTNYHVIENAAKLKIEFGNKQTYETQQSLLVDAKRDLALIKIDATGLPAVTLGDSAQMEVGDAVVAVGSPRGYENTVSDGLVSGIRHFKQDDMDYLQTSAPITHGSSGGALFNMNGEVIGVTTLSFSSGGEVNFAIPSNDVKKFLSQPHKPQSLTEATASAGKGDTHYDTYGVASEIEDKLNQELSTFQNPLTGEKVQLEFYVDPGFTSKGNLNIEMNLKSNNLYNYLLGDFNQQNSPRTAELLGKILQIAHNAGGKNLTVTFYQNSTTRKLTTVFPGDTVRFLTSTGFYSVSHVFAWGAVDDKTGQMTYLIQPGLNDSEQQTKLLTP